MAERDQDDEFFADAMKTLGVDDINAKRSPPSSPTPGDAAAIRRAALGLDTDPADLGDAPADAAVVAGYDAQAEDAEFLAAMAEPTADQADEPSLDPLLDGRRELARVHVGTPKALRRRIKQGVVQHQAELDLHGQTREQARLSVERFVRQAITDGHAVVRVIAGRGLHSDSAVLMHAVAQWSRGPLAKYAYTALTAPQSYGGEGVTYFFLRRFADS